MRMRISELLNENNVEIAAELADKDDALHRLIRLHKENGSIGDETDFTQKVYAREQIGSTALSGRIAIPCGIGDTIERPALTAVTVRGGVEFGAPDKKDVRIIFMIAGTDAETSSRIKVRLQRLLMDAGFAAKLCAAKDTQEFLSMLKEREDKRFPVINAATDRKYDCSKFLQKNYERPAPRKKRLFSRKRSR